MSETNERKKSILGATTTHSDPAIQAYMDARAISSQQKNNWDVVSDISGDMLASIQRHREAVQYDEDLKKQELQEYEDQFAFNVGKITENAGSLGEEYFGLATEEAKKMQEEYMNAVKNEDKETQGKLKMRLQGLSTSVQSLKENLTIAAELKNNEQLSAGRTEEDKLISVTCTDPANITYQDGEWVWKNPKYDPKNPKSKEFFTQDDLMGSLGEIEAKNFQKYREYENSMNLKGEAYINGDPNAGRFERSRIKTSIADTYITQKNIMSMMHDDLRGFGDSHTFKAHLSEYLDMLSSDRNFYKNLLLQVMYK